MFELVEQQPSHLACPDVLNLSLGECEGHRATSQVGGHSCFGSYMVCAVFCPLCFAQVLFQLLLTFRFV